MTTSGITISEAVLLPTLEEVVKASKTWTLFAYAPKTNDLRHVSSGTTTMKEMLEDMSDGRVHFAYVRDVISDKIVKYILVCWCGEGVAPGTKAIFQRMLADVDAWLNRHGFAVSCHLAVKGQKDMLIEIDLQRWRMSESNR